jgi:hypothetical protein
MDRRKCPICQGTGFHDGQICPCITGKKPDGLPEIPDCFKDIFGDIWEGKHDERS